MTPAGIEPATFRFVAQHLNQCDTAVPKYSDIPTVINTVRSFSNLMDFEISKTALFEMLSIGKLSTELTRDMLFKKQKTFVPLGLHFSDMLSGVLSKYIT